jgi:cation transport protein ChaC
MSDFWVFGYGSLMWRPGFDFVEQQPALLPGAHRALCIYSWVHRGTQARPGLVLGLDRGGACRGVAYRVADANRESVLAYLRERELVTDVYREAWRNVRLLRAAGTVTAPALTYLVVRDHVQYAGRLPPERLLELVRSSAGKSGRNAEYVINTASQLNTLGIRDPVLEWLAEALKRA